MTNNIPEFPAGFFNEFPRDEEGYVDLTNDERRPPVVRNFTQYYAELEANKQKEK